MILWILIIVLVVLAWADSAIAGASCPAYRGCERLRFYPALL
jgi:hypothetical protein